MNDDEITAEQLDCKYNPNGDGEHPTYTRSAWRLAVTSQETSAGYWQWVEYSLKNN